MNRISQVGKFAAVSAASVLVALWVSPLFAQTAPSFLPNTAGPVAGYSGAAGTATAYNGSNVACTTAATLGGSCTMWGAAGAQGANSAGSWYNSTYNGDNTPLATELFFPMTVGYDSWGNLYWADRYLSMIREIPASAPNTVVTVLGTASTVFSSTSYSLFDCTSLTTAAPAITATGCLQGSLAKGDTTPGSISAASLTGYGFNFGMNVDSWGNIVIGDGNHIRVIYGQTTNKAGTPNPFAAYLESLYFGTISGTTVTVGAKYLANACIDNATGNGGNPCNSSSRFTGVSAPITGNVYMLAGKYLFTTGLPTNGTGGGSPGLNNDYALVSIANTVTGSQYKSGTNNMVEGNFPLMVTMGDGIYGVGEDSSGNVYFTDAGTRVLRVINIGSSSITVAGINVDAFSVGTIAGALGVTGQPGDAGSNCTYSPLNGSSSDSCTGAAQTVTTLPNYSAIGSSTLSPIATSGSTFQLMGAVGIYVDQWGNIYLGQSGAAVTDGNSKGIYVIYAGAPNAVTGSGNPLNNALGILYGPSNVIQNDVYLLAGNGLSTRTVYYQWIPSAAGYGNTTSASGFSDPGYMVTDAQGNLYFTDQAGDRSVYRLDAATAHVSLLAGFNASALAPTGTVNYSAASPSAPVACGVINASASVAVTGTNTSVSAINPFGDGCSTFGVATGIPDGIALDPNGNIVFADGGFNVIRTLVVGNVFGTAASPLSVDTKQWLHVHFYGNNLPSSLTTPYTGNFTLTGSGAVAFTLGTPICSANTKDVSMTASVTNGAYTGGSYDCYVPVTFKASTYGNSSATLNAVTVSGTNGTLQLTAYSSNVGLLTATTTVTAPTNATPSQLVTVTVTVTGTGATPTGKVTLTATPTGGSATTLLNAAGLTNGSASYTGQLPVGTDTLVATYTGDSYYNPSTSNAVITAVGNLATTTTLTSSTGNVVPNQALTLTATVTTGSGAPTGTVTFSSTSTGLDQGVLATVPLNNGVASYYGLVWVGSDGITATYSGDANYAPSTSNTVTVVNAAVTGKLIFNWPYLNWAQPVVYGATTTAWPVTLQNLSGGTIATPSISFSGAGATNFQISSNGCNGTMSEGTSCLFNVVFRPTAGGSSTGAATTATLTASTSTSANYTGTLAVSGVAISNSLIFNWPFVNFPAQIAGSIGSKPWPVTVSNLTTQALTGLTYTLTGVNNYQSGAFQLTNTCTSLAAGASCTFNVAPSPTAVQLAGAYSANLLVSGTGGSTQYSSGAFPISGSVIASGYTINWNQDQQTASDGSGKTYSTIDFGPQNAVLVTAGPWPITVYNNTAATQTLTLTPSLGVFSVSGSTCTSVVSGGNCTFNLYFTPTALAVYQGTLVIAGGGYSNSINVWGQAATTPGGTGAVQDGQTPVSAAQVYMLAAGSSAYGGASTSLITHGSSGSSSIGQYVLTDANGFFSLIGDYSCTPGTLIYVLAEGGNPGLSAGTNNQALALMSILGTCPASGYFTNTLTSITVNEVTTVATAYALAGFMTDATHLSSGSSALSISGLSHAYATVSNLININAGSANSVSPANGSGAVPQAEIDTLANILASCVHTTGSVVASPATPCYSLLSSANTGTMPTNTVQAILNIAHSPAHNVSALYQLAGTAAFTPTLNAAPNDWTVGITFSSASYGNQPASMAVDGSGNVWTIAQDLNSVNEMNSQGVAATASPFTGFSLPTQLAIDSLGNAWVTNSQAYGPTVANLGVSEVLANGSATNNYTTGGVTLPLGVAIDASNNVWTANQTTSGGNVSHITNAGAAFTSNAGPFGSTEENGVSSLAIDPSGNVWSTTFYNSLNHLNGTTGALMSSNNFSSLTLGALAIDSNSVVWIADPNDGVIAINGSTGSTLTGSPFTAAGIQNASSIALDGANNVWVASYQPHTSGCTGYISGITSTGTAITSSTGYTTPTLNTETAGCVYSLAVDGSGNIWLAGPQTITQFVGAATPVQTPISPTGLAVRP